ncbi:hypothetical protein AGMMS50293_10950 [Spirochaetia bacterium]|nr:hypothetical protein AGMMS50293_10950 [Spirochaetia bacterium]
MIIEKRSFMRAALTAVVLALVLAGCGEDPVNGGNIQEYTVDGTDFGSTLASIRNTPGEYLVKVQGDVIDYPYIYFGTPGVKITLKGTGSNMITWKRVQDHQPLFVIENAELVLEDIQLLRSEWEGSDPLMVVLGGATVEIKSGVTITNRIEDQGVWIDGGTFIMSGGTISGNRAGVSMGTGSFIMKNGTITGNVAGAEINGDGASITMSGGSITGNTDSGVGIWSESINSSFTISGGSINDNAIQGVYIAGTDNSFTMSGGSINGNTNQGVFIAGTDNSFSLRGGSINESNYGVYINGTDSSFSLQGGSINDNNYQGVRITDTTTGIIFTMTNGNISNNLINGVHMSGTNNLFTISGGNILTNGSYGVLVRNSKNSTFNKTGGTIYGQNDATNTNTNGAVRIDIDSSLLLLQRINTTGTNDNRMAKTNTAGNGITERSGNWD